MKDLLLQHVADNMDKALAKAKGEHSFEGYKDHPERYFLLIQALQLRFKTLTPIEG